MLTQFYLKKILRFSSGLMLATKSKIFGIPKERNIFSEFS